MVMNQDQSNSSEARDQSMGLAQAVQPEEQYSFPCTTVQETCWLFEQTAPGTPMNNIAVRFKLRGKLDIPSLETALIQIVERHEVLRTRVIEYGGVPMQIAESRARFALKVADLRSIAKSERSQEAERISIEEARVGFEVGVGPLFRGQLLLLEDEDAMLLLTMHHIISDGWSVGIITDELGALYEALRTGKSAELPELAIQYADYALWQKEWEASGALGEELAHWKKKVDGFTPLQIRTDFERPANPHNLGEIVSIVLPRSLTDRMKEIGDQGGCTLFMTMLSAFLVLMQRESGQTDIVLRSPAAGRGRVELEPLIGWFVNPLVLRTEVRPEMTFQELLGAVQETVLDAFEHQDIPFERVMEEVRAKSSNTRQPPLPVNFVMQRDFVRPWKRAGLELTAVPSKSSGTFVDINFFLVEREDGWRASVELDTDLFSPSTGLEFLANFKTLMIEIGQHPQETVAELGAKLQVRQFKNVAKQKVAEFLAPITPLEKEVAGLWERTLRVSPIGLTDNFFDLGGYSMLAAQLLRAVQKQFGSQIKLPQMFSDPTVGGMVKALSSSNEISGLDVIQIKPGGALPPVVMVGGDHWFRPLAKRMSEARPMIGLPLARYEKLKEAIPIRDIAKDLADGMEAMDVPGPYVLAGWCVDGVVAFELANQLIARNRQVGLVILFDAINPAYRNQLNKAGFFEKSTRYASALVQKSKLTDFPNLLRDFTELGKAFRNGLLGGAAPQAEPVEDLAQFDRDRQEFRQLLYAAERSYTAPSVEFPVLLIRSPIKSHQRSDLGWLEICKGSFEVVEIEADHIGMFREPSVQKLAAFVEVALERPVTKSST